MIGGKVVDVWIWEGNCVSTVVQDNQKCLEVRLHKDENSLLILRGDSLWWQSNYAYWTPDDRTLTDVKIERIGYSTPASNCRCAERTRFSETIKPWNE